MPSNLVVKCVPIKNVRPHPNADNLLIIEIMGWQVCTHKDTKPEVGDLRVFIPPDAVLTDELAQELDVTNYLKKGNRVGQVKLRGELSFGIAANNQWGFAIGEEVSEKLGITKWVAPVIPSAGDQERDHPLFINYARIENWRNYPDLFVEGELINALEKVHGTNSKVGVTQEVSEDGSDLLTFMIGSHNTRKKLTDTDDPDHNPKLVSIYQYPLKRVRPMLADMTLAFGAKIVIAYGEIFGRVQDLRYGRPNSFAYRAFDLYVDGKFLDWAEVVEWCTRYKIEYTPVVYSGPYSADVVKKYANQNTLLMPADTAHMSEGVIIRPIKERTDPSVGRVILKLKSDAYEDRFARGKGTEYA